MYLFCVRRPWRPVAAANVNFSCSGNFKSYHVLLVLGTLNQFRFSFCTRCFRFVIFFLSKTAYGGIKIFKVGASCRIQPTAVSIFFSKAGVSRLNVPYGGIKIFKAGASRLKTAHDCIKISKPALRAWIQPTVVSIFSKIEQSIWW